MVRGLATILATIVVALMVVGCTQAPAPTTSETPAPAVAPSPSPAAALAGPDGEKLEEQSAEARFQLDLHVADAALAPFMPNGWSSNVAITGAAKDANLRVIFIDRLTVNGPTGQPVGTNGNRLVQLVAPVKDQTGAAAMLVIGGLTEDSSDVPGPFGNYLQAGTHKVTRSTSDNGSGSIYDSQDWVFEATSGEHLELHVTYDRGIAVRGPSSDTRFYSAKNPSVYQLARQEQVLDILRNVTTTPPDRVHAFLFTCVGGSYASVCDGSQKVLSWDNVVWTNRQIFQP
jgi:hypothetical protein